MEVFMIKDIKTDILGFGNDMKNSTTSTLYNPATKEQC